MSSSQQVGARFCKLELSGESNIYVCPRDEYCCNIGCCISPTFQFYQLWYYWFMVFFMFLVCSGGQWWYRYVMQGRCASAIAPPARRGSYPRQARVAYTPARDTVVLHHQWKPNSGPGMNGPPPSYSASGCSTSSASTLSGPKPSPYMQLYGPPPSYESVIAAGPAPIHHGPQTSGAHSLNLSAAEDGGRSGDALHHLQSLEMHPIGQGLPQQSSGIPLPPPIRDHQQSSFSQPHSSLTQQQLPSVVQPQVILAPQLPSAAQPPTNQAQQQQPSASHESSSAALPIPLQSSSSLTSSQIP